MRSRNNALPGLARRMNQLWLQTLSICLTAVFFTACTGTRRELPSDLDLTAAPGGPATGSLGADTQATGPAQFPLSLPVDHAQPWDGQVQRGASDFDADSVWVPGSDYLQARGLFEGKAGDPSVLEIDSTPAGGTNPLSYALYRLPMAGAEPGAISLDVNLSAAAQSPAAGSGDDAGLVYWVGVANYASARWEWHGPMTDSAVRVATAAAVKGGASYLSELGNAFVAVVSYDGPYIEVLGLGAAPYDSSDNLAPEQVAFSALNDRPGGLDYFYGRLEDSSIAGYQVYYSKQPFTAASKGSARRLAWLDNSSVIAPVDQGLVSFPAQGSLYVAVAAVDLGGNEGPLSAVRQAQAGSGSNVRLLLSVDSAEGLVNSNSELQISFDPPLSAVEDELGEAVILAFDLDGDGSVDAEGLGGGTSSINLDTGKTGILRPRAYAYASGGEYVAHGSVSLFISSNAAPHAVLNADQTRLLLTPDKNAALGTVKFDMSASSDPDNSYDELDFSLDHDGDGVFEAISGSQLKSVVYSQPGPWLCSLKATDPAGYSTSASVMIQARMLSSFEASKGALTAETSNKLCLAKEQSSGTMAMFFYEGSTIYCVRSVDASGTAWGSPEVAASDVFLPGRISALGLNGRFLLVYQDHSSETLMACRTSGVYGSWSSSATIADTGNANETGLICSAAMIGGVPVVAYFEEEGDGQHKLLYRPASDNQANAWGGAAAVQVDVANLDPGTADNCLVLLEVGGEPAVFYVSDGELSYERRGKLLDIPNWSSSGALLDATESIHTSGLAAAIIGGNPAVAYSRFDSSKTVFMRAEDATGFAWAEPVVFNASGSQSLALLSLPDGRAALYSISNSADASLRFNLSLDNSASSWTGFGYIRSGGCGDDCAALLGSLGQPIAASFSYSPNSSTWYDLNCVRPVY